MDIDDILASVDRNAVPPETRDLQALTRSWVAERVAPELLPYPDALMGRVMQRIRRQIEVIEEQTGTMDPKASFRLVILQTELERVKFLVRSFLRARIKKIDTHPHHTLTLPASTLSPPEHAYLTTHLSLLSTHYSSAFLASFPPALRRLDDTAGGISMVDAPDAESAIFVRCLRDCEVEGVMVGAGTEEEEGGRERERVVRMRRGDVWVLRWRVVRGGVERGDVEVI